MNIVFSNTFLINFCENYFLQEHYNSKNFCRILALILLGTFILINITKRIVPVFDLPTSFFIEKLPLITQNGGILVIKIGD